MKLYDNQKGSFDLTTSIAIFLVCLIISLAVAAFHYWYFPTRYLDFKSAEIQQLFGSDNDFKETAKQILNTRNDIVYLKLLDQNGVLEESFGNQNALNTKKFSFNGSGNKTIVAGIKTLSYNQIDGYALLWSLVIGSIISIILLFIIFLVSPSPNRSLEKLSESLKKAAAGDLSVRLNIDFEIKNDEEIAEIYNNFNSLMDSISTSNDNFYASNDVIGEYDDLSMELPSQEISDEDNEEIVVDDIDKKEYKVENIEEFDDYENIENIENIMEPQIPDETSKPPAELILYPKEIDADRLTSVNADKITDKEPEVFSPFKPKVVSVNDGNRNQKNRNVTVLVAKISDFEALISELEPSDLNSFITEYRKKASSIIAEYGGVIEALLQNEIVAIFNAPDKQDHPELRSISASVEIMQLIADLAKKRKAEGKRIISGKIGISLSSITFFSETGIPDKIKDVVDNSRLICDNTENWKIFVSGELYDCVREHVDVKQAKVNEKFYFSITGVEEGVLRI
ncbi:MAG: hypothetical protein ACRENO_00880 [Thermodesulfobacteriota bacterium]